MKIAKKYFILFILLLSISVGAGAHPYYVSICQVDFNRESQALEIALKIFTDDLSLALESKGERALFIGDERESAKAERLIREYVDSRLHFKINDVPVSCNYVGKEPEAGAMWIYFEIKDIKELLSLDVECSLLVEVLDSQNNIIQVNKDGKVKNLLLNRRELEGRLTFE